MARSGCESVVVRKQVAALRVALAARLASCHPLDPSLPDCAMPPKRNSRASAAAGTGSKPSTSNVGQAQGSSSATQAAGGEPALTSTQQAIRSLLRVDSLKPDQAILALLELESRQLQSSSNADQLQTSYCCCFDTTSVAAPAWTSQSVC